MTDSALPPWPSRPALFLDVDGTLLEIAAHPAHAAPSQRLGALLPLLPAATDGAVAMISGRRIEDLDRLLEPHTFVAAGVHGLQRRNDLGRVQAAGAESGIARDVHARLAAFAERHPGVWVEDKSVSVALHYRARPELESEVHRFAGELQRELPSDVELLLGRKIIEIKPRVANKGDAIRAFMEERPFTGRTPIFVGDDVTDEAGFEAVNALDGVSVKVGPGATAARWRLGGVDDVLGWLERAVVHERDGYRSAP